MLDTSQLEALHLPPNRHRRKVRISPHRVIIVKVDLED